MLHAHRESCSCRAPIRASRSCHEADERISSLALQLAGQGCGVDAGLSEGGYDLVGVSAVGGQEIPHYPVVGERLQRVVRQGVDGERGGQRVHVQHVRRSRGP